MPLICLPPVSGTADVFYQQCMALSTRGYRVIAVSKKANMKCKSSLAFNYNSLLCRIIFLYNNNIISFRLNLQRIGPLIDGVLGFVICWDICILKRYVGSTLLNDFGPL